MMIPQNYYSSTAHVRNRRRDLKGNVLTYIIPGLNKSIDIPFPDRKLPVCKRCKKIYKTRELCRIRDGHTDIPWNTTYICMTMDESCVTRDASGNMRLVDEDSYEFRARSITGPPMPYRAKAGAIGGTKTPICMACKDKNYTRHHCREKQQHQQLPWNTVYVMLSAVPNSGGYGGGGFSVEDDIRQIGSKRSSSSISSDDRAPKKMKSEDSSDSVTLSSSSETNTEAENAVVEEDDIHNVQTSRAFLLVVGKEACKVQWLEIDPLVPRPVTNDYNNGPWENSENVDPHYPTPGPMMMNGMNGMSGNFNNAWQGFNSSHGPSSKFHPMMGMGMGMGMMCGPAGNFPQNGPPFQNNSGSSQSVGSDRETDRYSPNASNMRGNDRQVGGFNPYDQSNFGMNGPMGPNMGPGMMNNNQGGQYNNPSGMFGGPQLPYPDDRDSNGPGNGNTFPPSLKQHYDGPPNGMNALGNSNNMMGNMSRNFNDYNNSMGNGPQGSFPSMNSGGMPPNGFPFGGVGGGPGGDFYRGGSGRNNGNHPSNNGGGPPFPPNNRGQIDQLSMPHTPQQQGGMYSQPPPHPADQQFNGAPNKPPVLM